MHRNVKNKRNWKEKTFKAQEGKCYWCSKQMVLTIGVRFHVVPDDVATIEHLDHKLSPRRGQPSGESRRVLACRKCNEVRGARDLDYYSAIARKKRKLEQRRKWAKENRGIKHAEESQDQ